MLKSLFLSILRSCKESEKECKLSFAAIILSIASVAFFNLVSLSPFNNKIYLTNHGAKGGDWFGIAEKGENYGWKILGWGGTNYTGTKIGPKWKPGFVKAIKYWVP